MPTVNGSTDHHSSRPLIVEVAINGSRTKADFDAVPLSADEIVRTVSACVEAGATIVHAHAGQAVVGAGARHEAAPYVEPFTRVLERHPGLLMYPTLPGGGVGTTMAQRLAHVCELADLGLVGLLPVDPGTMNYGRIDDAGRPPEHDKVYQTTFADVSEALSIGRRRGLPCTLSLFEPGFARLVEAHRLAGTLPAGSIVKLEFSAGARLFGLPPDEEGLACWLRLFDSRRVPWMVTLRDGDVTAGLAKAAMERGGHVRVGLEDFAGPSSTRNEDLVEAAVALGRSLGREPADATRLEEVLLECH